MNVIENTEDLAALCDRLSRGDFIVIDTEFMRDSSYYSRLCLIQIAGADEEAIIDPLANGLDLTPFFDLLYNAKITKVMHAARQDIEIFHDMMQRVPRPVFDTQIAAMALGYGDSVGYGALVKGYLGVNVDKGARFTNWAQRPLTNKQLAYALADVTHLRKIYPRMVKELEKLGRLPWVTEEMEPQLDPELYQNDPDKAWERLKLRSNKREFLAVLKAVAAWREKEAQDKNVPRGRVMKDDALYALATQRPLSREALKKMRGIPGGFDRSRSADKLLAAIKYALDNKDSYAPPAPKVVHMPPNLGPAIDMLKTLLRLRTEYENIAPRLVANSSDIEQIAAFRAKAKVPALTGWRRDLFGADALDMMDGKIALRLKGSEVVAERLED